MIDQPCYNNPCLNGATCQENGNSYTCLCPQFYSGVNCEKYSNACTISPCLNGGTCSVTGLGDTYTCVCRAGYSGTNCQTCKPLNLHPILSSQLLNFINCNLS